ncbi:MAG: YDG domain-containing protein, partial [Oscillospiraceae bacterium]|nr:YDG domain-containing protein [Oscillospiraceae bacterium]
MRNVIRRALSILLATLVILIQVPLQASAATATNVTYLDANGTEQTCNSATVVTSSDTTWSSGWYVVNSDVTNNNRIEVSGDVNLILTDGCTLTASSGIHVYSTNSLTIYAQSTGDNMGSLVANGGSSKAGIGSNYVGSYTGETGGTITINGGNITATADASVGDPAAIGGGGYCTNPTVIINGGNVTATGSQKGIGTGAYGTTGTIQINGGTVTANGIGTGLYNASATTTISGNSVVFSTENNNGYINTTNQSSWNGVIFLGESGSVYGTVTLTSDLTIPSGYTLVVPDGTSLTIAAGVTLTNNGTITIEDGGTFTNSGTFTNNGTINITGGFVKSSSSGLVSSGSGTITITGGCFVTGDISAQTVYSKSPASGYYVIPNTEASTMSTYPYLVSSTIPVFYSSATAEKVYDGTTAFDEDDIDITFEDINGDEATGVDYTATGNTSSADAGTYTDGLTFEASVGTGYILLDTDYSVISTLQKTITASITQKELTISSVTVDGKAYDGTTAVDSSAIGDVTFTDGTNEVTLTAGTDYTVSAVYDSAEVGTQSVTVTVTLLNSNYTLTDTSYTTTAAITQKEIYVSDAAVSDKVYDGTTDVDDSAITVTFSSGSSAGSEITLTRGTDYTVSAVYDGAEVGTHDVTVTATLINGNYTLTNSTYVTTAAITEQGLTFTAVVEGKDYDGTTDVADSAISTVTFTDGTNEVTLIRDTDYTVSAEFADSDVGNQDVTVTVTMLNSNYTLTESTYTTSAVISQYFITISSVDVSGKVYDGTTDVADSAIGDVTFTDGANEIALTKGTDYTVTAEFADSDVGTQTVTVTVTLLNGNYVLESFIYRTTAEITAQGLTFTADVSSKVYDGTTDVDDSAITLT